MKKIIALLLALAMCLSLCACGSADQKQSTSIATEAVMETLPVPTETTIPAPVFITETAHCILDGIYVDNSFVDENNPSMKMVYVCFTAYTNDKNLDLSSKVCQLTFESGNTYSSETFSKASGKYLSSYYYDNSITHIYIGESKKVLTTFMVPEGEFKVSSTMTITPYGLPDGEKLFVSVEDVNFFDSVDALAQTADADGYAAELLKHEPADGDTVAKVKAAINGYKWNFFVNSTSYEIEFYSPNKFELRVNAFGVANGGTYEVLNGYVVCTYDSNGSVVEIPFSWGPNDIDLDVISAFAV